MKIVRLAAPLAVAAVLAGCSRDGEISVEGGVGIQATRTACPIVGVPANTGDITLFDPPASRDAAAIDVVANITNVRSQCSETGDDVITTVTFDVLARRSRADAARTVTLPYFIAIVRGGTNVTAKRVADVTISFPAGQPRGQAQATATSVISRAAATLPQEVRDQLTKRRRAGQEDAAIDPLTAPGVRAAVARATFEALVGFQLTDEQLRYNATR
ncbi:hypothetical protein COC42_02540 [Sphingomonas spermidinifaciens]|uniref:Lipoprotein n=1 Tax=Sphingomonas spermidinifaciens TaxID=1141889 RepID=A0A2A4B5E0_9SPHN|nr:hypothetical protein [Sphingomonas spermidinifaciens]PCD03300.1 hypothetical protein COC42_02540 [Sphingomonas spermidinifaciens]